MRVDGCKKLLIPWNIWTRVPLFGNKKDESFKGSIGAIYQSYDVKDLYPTLEKKAANHTGREWNDGGKEHIVFKREQL